MVTKLVGGLIAFLFLASNAQAQVVEIVFDGELVVANPSSSDSFSFTLTSPASLDVSAASFSSFVGGTGFVDRGATVLDSFGINDTSFVPHSYTLGAGTYTLVIDGTNSSSMDNPLILVDANTVTPVPEPQVYAMLLAGLLVIGIGKRRRILQNR